MTEKRRSGTSPASPRLLGFTRSALVVPLSAGAGALAFLAWKPGVARSMIGSPRALGFSVLVGTAVLGLGWVLPRLGRSGKMTALVQALPVVLAFGLTVLPALRDTTVDEVSPLGMSAGSVTPSITAAGGPVELGRAHLAGINHRAVGEVVLIRTPQGVVVRFQSLDVEPGPDYHVYVVEGSHSESPRGGVHLGKLRGNKGSLNYLIPSGTSARLPLTVLVWCRAFSVPVAASTIT